MASHDERAQIHFGTARRGRGRGSVRRWQARKGKARPPKLPPPVRRGRSGAADGDATGSDRQRSRREPREFWPGQEEEEEEADELPCASSGNSRHRALPRRGSPPPPAGQAAGRPRGCGHRRGACHRRRGLSPRPFPAGGRGCAPVPVPA